MKFSPNLSKLDEKNLTLCRYCQVLLADFFLERHIIPQLKKYEGTLPPAVATPIRESVRKRRR
jgi:hypothetical protein